MNKWTNNHLIEINQKNDVNFNNIIVIILFF